MTRGYKFLSVFSVASLVLVTALFLFALPLMGVFAQDSRADTSRASNQEELDGAPQNMRFEENIPFIFFYSPSCQYCQAQQIFLDEIALEYPALPIIRYDITKTGTSDILDDTIALYPEAERYRGLVPLSFYDEYFFVGFDDRTEAGMRRALQGEDPALATNTFSVPFLGSVSAEDHSLFGLAALLGLLDGFNVCSLGALMLILALVLKLRSRKLVLLYGGVFLGVTALMYMLLILAWHRLFVFVGPFVGALELVVGGVAILGALYLLSEFYRFQKHGLTCDSGSGRVVSLVSNKVEQAFKDGRAYMIAGAVAFFAAVVVIIEFPCSAAIPVSFAGMLALMDLPFVAYFGYIGVFMFFYLLDELIIFLIAVYSLRLWASSGKFVKWATLVAGLVLFFFGAYYLLAGSVFGERIPAQIAPPIGGVCEETSEDTGACELDLESLQ